MLRLRRGQQPVERGRTDRAQEFPLADGEPVMVAFIVAQPQRQGRAFPQRCTAASQIVRTTGSISV